jgi:hypothetical protein
MGAPKRDDVCEKDIVGLKYFDKILSMLDVLRDVGTGREKGDILLFRREKGDILLFREGKRGHSTFPIVND